MISTYRFCVENHPRPVPPVRPTRRLRAAEHRPRSHRAHTRGGFPERQMPGSARSTGSPRWIPQPVALPFPPRGASMVGIARPGVNRTGTPRTRKGIRTAPRSPPALVQCFRCEKGKKISNPGTRPGHPRSYLYRGVMIGSRLETRSFLYSFPPLLSHRAGPAPHGPAG